MDSSLFAPSSIAVIGATEREGSVGKAIVQNLLAGGFASNIWLVNPKHRMLFGKPCVASIRDLPHAPEMAVIVVPARLVLPIVEELGRQGVRLAILITAGFSDEEQANILRSAKDHRLRLLGPNSLGLLLPFSRINASFAPLAPDQGRLALLSQSGAILTSALDWASARSIGFSGLVSLGNAVDIDLPDLIDHFASDPKTATILIYMEAVRNARRFMSAARRAALLKPVVVLKVGRHPEGARAAFSHTGALAGSDLVYEAAFRRCGLIRVFSLEELFDAVELLSVQKPFTGENLGILTNGGGAGIIAADRLKDFGGRLAPLSPATVKALDKMLPMAWSHSNPVDIVGDADAKRYTDTLRLLLDDATVHAVLVLRCPTLVSAADEIANGVRQVVEEHRLSRDWHKPVLTCWLGGKTVTTARRIFDEADIPTFETPEDAIRAVEHLISLARARELMARQPRSTEQDAIVDRRAARSLIASRLIGDQVLMSEADAKALIAFYGIPVAPTLVASTPLEVAAAAAKVLTGEPRTEALVLKIVSPDITHKSDVGGVRLDIRSVVEAQTAVAAMLSDISRKKPEARIEGIAIQPMVRKQHGRQLILGINRDRTFGATLLFGAGGTAVEVIDDKSVELPPLDDHLASAMIARTRIAKLLGGYRHVPAVAMTAILDALMRLSRLARDCPEIEELDINPLLADDAGVIALDARVLLRRAVSSNTGDHLAIAPWPDAHESQWRDASGRSLYLRPILPTDEARYPAFLAKMRDDDLRMRLFAQRRHFDHGDFARWTQIDFGCEMAVVALDAESDELVGVAHYVSEPTGDDAEFAIMVRSDVQARGIGSMLMRQLISHARDQGLRRLSGIVLKENKPMRQLGLALGFCETLCPDEPGAVMVTLELERGECR